MISFEHFRDVRIFGLRSSNFKCLNMRIVLPRGLFCPFYEVFHQNELNAERSIKSRFSYHFLRFCQWTPVDMTGHVKWADTSVILTSKNSKEGHARAASGQSILSSVQSDNILNHHIKTASRGFSGENYGEREFMVQALQHGIRGRIHGVALGRTGLRNNRILLEAQ